MTTRQFEKHRIEDEVFDIRFNSESSMFFCHMFDKLFENESVKLLKETLTKEYNQLKKTIWEQVIEIELTGNSYSYCAVSGFDAELKFIGTMILPGGKKKKIIAHSTVIDFQGDRKDILNYEPCRPYRDYQPDNKRIKHIPYSLKKFESLKHIKNQMESLNTKIQEILSSENCENFLETASKNTLPQLEYEPKAKNNANVEGEK